jgi:hypothetical protein
MHGLPLLFLAFGLGIPAKSSAACSVHELRASPGYRWKVERIADFVDSADVIVRARVVGRDSLLGGPSGSTRWFPGVRLELVEALRDSIPASIVVPGTIVDRDDFNTLPVPYQMVRTSGQYGDCYASEYRLDAEYLLLLKRTSRGLTPQWWPLAPSNEQIRGADDAWVRWVNNRVLQNAEK